MRRSGKMILLLLAAVALCGGYLAVQHFSQKETVEAEDVQIALLDAEADEVTGLSWALDGETVSLQKADGRWTLDGDPDFPVDQEAARKLAEAVAGLTASRQLTGVETLADYGLEEPTFAVTVTLADGEWRLISQGALNALSGDAYVQVSGDDSVYIASDAPADAFDMTRSDLLAMEALPEIGDAMRIELTSPERGLALRCRSAGSGNYVDEATDRAMDGDAVEALIEALNAIDWTGCVSYAATDAERTQFGLDEPTARVRVSFSTERESGGDDGETTVESGEYALLLGGTSSDDGSVYAATAVDSPMIYTIGSEDARQIYDALDGGLESAKVFSADWDDVAEIRVRTGDGEMRIERDAASPDGANEQAETTAEPEATVEDTAEAEPESTEQPESTEVPEAQSAWLLDGQRVDAELWTRFTEAIDALESTAADEEGAGDALLSVEIELADGAVQSAEFLDSGADAYAIRGEAKAVDAAEIDALLRVLRHLAK